jgi:hypothetical protein
MFQPVCGEGRISLPDGIEVIQMPWWEALLFFRRSDLGNLGIREHRWFPNANIDAPD